MGEIRSFLLRHRQWVILLAVAGGGFVITSSLLTPGPGRVTGGRWAEHSVRPEAPFTPSPADFGSRGRPEPVPGEATGSERLGRASMRTYSVPLPELSGLPSDLQPGTAIELWVAWEKPFTRGPRVQRLMKNVVLERVAPPATPDGVPVAVLSVPRARLPDLIFADEWASISVAAY
jgi:hypothetical protein